MNSIAPNLLVDLLGFLSAIISLLQLVVVVSVVISWLVTFDVINTRNRGVYQIVSTLEGVSERLLYPIRRFVPPLAGLDLSPLIFLFLSGLVQRYLIGFLILQIRMSAVG